MSPDELGQLAGLAILGVSAGFLAGLLGIGGGVLLVPALVLLFGFDQHVAQGTSLLLIIPSAVLGSYTHHRNGRLVLRDAAMLAAGGVIGAALGGVFALSIEDAMLRKLFAAVLLVSAVRILWPRGRGTKAPEPETPGA